MQKVGYIRGLEETGVKHLSIDRAKELMLDYLQKHKEIKKIYPSDLADKLGIDAFLAIDASVELLKEGLIEIVSEGAE